MTEAARSAAIAASQAPLLSAPGQLTVAAPPGTKKTWNVTVTRFVTFATAGMMTPVQPLPAGGAALNSGTPLTVPVTITNTSNAPQDYFLDPRLNTTSSVRLVPLAFGTSDPFANGSASAVLPVAQGAATPLYFVPSLTSSLTLQQVSSVAAMTDLSTAIGGDPDIGPAGLTKSSQCGKSELQCGQSATVNVTFDPTGPVGSTDSGALYLDALQSGVPAYGQLAGDEVAALPYSYTVDIRD